MQLEIRRALPEDAAACVQMRGMTRENAVSPERLREYGITEQSWAEDIRANALPGYVCHSQGKLLGYAFGARSTGEVVVLALLPEAESQGLGRHLLALIVQELRATGHTRLFLGCSPDASSRSYGFYRHLGWQSTGTFDHAGDEVLELLA
jgi:GNAT superfamily N-acetyltransferase